MKFIDAIKAIDATAMEAACGATPSIRIVVADSTDKALLEDHIQSESPEVQFQKSLFGSIGFEIDGITVEIYSADHGTRAEIDSTIKHAREVYDEIAQARTITPAQIGHARVALQQLLKLVKG